jgi:hypothetical protein
MASRTLWSGTEPKPLPRIRKSTLRRGGAGEPNGLSGGLANFDQAGGTRTIGAKASGESFKEQFGRASTPAVDDHVNSLLRISSERLAEGVFGFIEADDGIYSGGLEGSEIPACADDALGAEMPGHLNGEAASDSSGDQDEDGFSGGEAGPFFEREPGRHTGVGNGSGEGVVKAVGQQQAFIARDDGELGHGSARLSGEGEVHAGAVFEGAHAVDPRHHWNLSCSCRMAGGSERF